MRTPRLARDAGGTSWSDHSFSDCYKGKRLNSPSDVVVKSDHSRWFTNPSYAILTDDEGDRADSEIGTYHVYRVGQNGSIQIVADAYYKPSSLAFLPD
ncbi:MAG: hypothetical protein AB8B47_11045 [Roseobacter sp.]